jgi:hypothetical protein
MASKRPRSKSKARLTREGERLVTLALGLAASGSRAEDRFWEAATTAQVGAALDTHHDTMLDGALDYLHQTNGIGYEELIDVVEGAAESATIARDDITWDVLLISAPVIASSKYSIPTGPIEAEHGQALGQLIQGEVVASQARLALATHLFSIEHLPRRFSALRDLARKLGEAAIAGEAPVVNLARVPETPHMLADIRFLLGAIAAPRGAPHFRWQEVDSHGHVGRAQCMDVWTREAMPVLVPLFAGCQFESLLPDAYFANSREADRRVRPVSLRAAVTFLAGALQATPTELRAVIAGFGEGRIDEFRVGLTENESNDVAYGVVWPLYDNEDETTTPGPLEDIETTLRACGVTRIEKLTERFAPEFCADCGAPLFADPAGDVVHAELPEEADVPPQNYLH